MTSRAVAAIIPSLLVLLLLTPAVSAQQFSSSSLTLTVYADGSASVAQLLAANSSDVSIVAQLLSPILTDVTVVDQNGAPLSYQISGSNITVYTLGATGVTLQYDTEALTDKQGTVWTLNFTTAYPATAILPRNSTVISVSSTPQSLTEQGQSPVVSVSAGTWQVDYGVPASAEASTSSTSTSPANTSSSSATGTSASQTASTQTSSTLSSTAHPVTTSPSQQGLGSAALATVILAVAAVAGAALYIRRRNSFVDTNGPDLRPDDIKVLNFIAEQGGKVFEPDIRAKFVLPKTSTWRQIKRLERLGYVRISKVGSQNQVELLKNRERPGV